jgi:hypothetical protein
MYNMTVTASEHMDCTLVWVSVSETDDMDGTEPLFSARGQSDYVSPYADGDPLLIFLTRVIDGVDQALSTGWKAIDAE